MRCTFLVLLNLLALTSLAQRPELQVRPIRLPKEIAYYDNQFSGLYVSGGRLLLLSESRLQDKAEGKLYSIALADLDRQLADTAYVLPYRKLHLYNLEALRDKINARNQAYEGLEALVVVGQDVYLSVETNTPSAAGFLLRGTLSDTAVVVDPEYLVEIPKPTFSDGTHVYNAAFEALAADKKGLTAFFEYNSFPAGSFAYTLHSPAASKAPLEPVQLETLPFRITDITRTGRRRFTALNYFFNGEGEDAVYRPAAADAAADALVRTGTAYRSYSRLVQLKRTRRGFTWQPLADLPPAYWGYNWEGIAAYRHGYFLLNDKYTPRKPYSSVLLYGREIRK